MPGESVQSELDEGKTGENGSGFDEDMEVRTRGDGISASATCVRRNSFE